MYPPWKKGIDWRWRSAPSALMKLGGLANPFFSGLSFRGLAAAPSSQQIADGVSSLRRGLHRRHSVPTAACLRATFPPTRNHAATQSYGMLSSGWLRRLLSVEKQAMFSGTAARVYRLEV